MSTMIITGVVIIVVVALLFVGWCLVCGSMAQLGE